MIFNTTTILPQSPGLAARNATNTHHSGHICNKCKCPWLEGVEAVCPGMICDDRRKYVFFFPFLPSFWETQQWGWSQAKARACAWTHCFRGGVVVVIGSQAGIEFIVGYRELRPFSEVYRHWERARERAHKPCWKETIIVKWAKIVSSISNGILPFCEIIIIWWSQWVWYSHQYVDSLLTRKDFLLWSFLPDPPTWFLAGNALCRSQGPWKLKTKQKRQTFNEADRKKPTSNRPLALPQQEGQILVKPQQDVWLARRHGGNAKTLSSAIPFSLRDVPALVLALG